MKTMHRFEDGFTLIEILVVLAIAGVIMLVIFLAVTGAQRAQRDRARQDVINRFVAGLNQYASNTTGIYPTTGTLAQFGVILPGTISSTTLVIGNTQPTPAVGRIDWVVTTTPPSSGLVCGDTPLIHGYLVTGMENSGIPYCLEY